MGERFEVEGGVELLEAALERPWNAHPPDVDGIQFWAAFSHRQQAGFCHMSAAPQVDALQLIDTSIQNHRSRVSGGKTSLNVDIPNKHQDVTKHGKFWIQNNRFPIITLVQLKDNSIVDITN